MMSGLMKDGGHQPDDARSVLFELRPVWLKRFEMMRLEVTVNERV